MIKNFKTFDLAVRFYNEACLLGLKGDARSQLDRAARSVVLNLAEGRGYGPGSQQMRHYRIAFASVRECQALLLTARLQGSPQAALLDKLAASLYLLIKRAR